MKKVLVLCTGNSCRSIIAEALINSELGDRIEAYSSGVSASGLVNPNAKKILEIKNIWKDEYHSKDLKHSCILTLTWSLQFVIMQVKLALYFLEKQS